MTTALLLHEAGARVVLLEANRVGHGVTGHTTAKVSSQHGLSTPVARQARCGGGAHVRPGQRGRRWPGSPGASSATGSTATSGAARPTPTSRPPICAPRSRTRQRGGRGGAAGNAGREHPAAVPRRRGRPLRQPGGVSRPQVPAGARAAQLPADQVFERTHAIQIGSSDARVVHTPGGRVTAGHVIVATHFPFPDRSLAFARVHPAALLRAGLPDRRHAARRHAHQRRLADAVGSRRPARRRGTAARRRRRAPPRHGGDTEEHYRALETFAREHWDVRSVDYRSSARTTRPSMPCRSSAG